MSGVAVINREIHGQKNWLRYKGYAFAGKDLVCPLVMQELHKAIMGMPVAFTASGDSFKLVAVMGLEENHNLFVASDGRWLGRYIPAHYRSYPFLLAKAPDNSQVLCVRENSDLIVDAESASAGEPFFDGDGKPAEELAKILDFLNQVHANRVATQRICDALQKLDLIKEWPLTIKDASGTRQINGLYRVDEEALHALSAKKFLSLRDNGALTLAYCQIFSMQHINELLLLKNTIAEASTSSSQAESINDELDFDMGKSNNTIDFSNI